MARFFGVETETSYSEALGVRGVAKYAKSATQITFSALLVTALLLSGPAPASLLVTLGGAVAALVAVGLLGVLGRDLLTRATVLVVTPVAATVSRLYRDEPHSRASVADAVARFRTRVGAFRDTPELLALVAVGGLLEQLLTAGALWVALAGTGTGVAFVAVVALVPLPQAASVVPIPGSLGAYDVLLAGALVAITAASGAGAAAAVLVVRTFGLLVSIGGGGLAVAFLEGWRP
jgi:uncharacterized membrane protein YbhN (UPF0104 family)